MTPQDIDYVQSPIARDQRMAEGWQFSRALGQGALTIVRIPPDTFVYYPLAKVVFDTDEDANTFVKRRALEGSDFHVRCLAYLVFMRLTQPTKKGTTE